MNSSVRNFRLRAEPSGRAAPAITAPVSPDHYGQVIASSARITDPDGKLVAVLLRDALPLQAGGSMYRAISPLLRAQAKIKHLNTMHMGLWEAEDGFAPTSFGSIYPRATERCSAALSHLSAVYKAYMPEAFGRQAALLEQPQNKRWALQSSVFTSVRMELNMGGTYRHDQEPPASAARVLWGFRGGQSRLSHVVLPRQNLALSMDSLDVLLLAADEPWGMTAIKDSKEWYERIICEGTLRGAHP